MGTLAIEELAQFAAAGRDFSVEEARAAARAVADAETPAEPKADLLRALAAKGETADEVAAFAEVFRGLARDPGVSEVAASGIDIVGTGGDGVGSFNISTTAAMIVAACGVPVLKHGNRSITSKCGSADFLEALGCQIDAEIPKLQSALAELNFCFLFAPEFHPAFKVVGPVRKALAAEGVRTIFNLLGPLINPAKPAFELMGVFAAHWVEPLAAALDHLGCECGLVAHCRLSEDSGLDELSTAGTNIIGGVGQLGYLTGRWTPEDIQLPGCHHSQLAGGDVAANLRLLGALMDGAAIAGLEDTVCLNAGAALWIAGSAATLTDGVERARDCLTEGELRLWLEHMRRFFHQ